MTARGRAWEAQLERLHDAYRRDRLAVVLRAHPPVRVHEDRGPTFVGSWSASGPPDFVGLLASGRGLALDAKDCTAARWPLASLERHQARDLEAVHIAGGVAGVALRLAGDGYWLDWRDLGPRYWAWLERAGRAEKGTASLAVESWWRPFDVAGAGWISCL